MITWSLCHFPTPHFLSCARSAPPSTRSTRSTRLKQLCFSAPLRLCVKNENAPRSAEGILFIRPLAPEAAEVVAHPSGHPLARLSDRLLEVRGGRRP